MSSQPAWICGVIENSPFCKKTFNSLLWLSLLWTIFWITSGAGSSRSEIRTTISRNNSQQTMSPITPTLSSYNQITETEYSSFSSLLKCKAFNVDLKACKCLVISIFLCINLIFDDFFRVL